MGIRYSRIETGNRREIVLLKGFPCSYGKCKFCNYIEDNSTDREEIVAVNEDALREVRGDMDVLEVINSGSVFELPHQTLSAIRDLVAVKGIKTLYFEAYYGYIKRLPEIREFFKGTEIRFRIGLETFDDNFRIQGLGKNFSLREEEYKVLGEEFYSACLLVCIEGQSREMIRRDIEMGLRYFKSITVNVFIDNGTPVKQDKELVKWFVEEFGHLAHDSRVEILLDNKDLGVFEQ
ncbi:radical SAM protein [Propionigenium maris DSM 9537]|uniref:Radical SAM protein n=1 Tax=Propionigenium maris DSM 9537 TaxID=1123000 RepID=A0A9W6GFX6_9FUSO|nr:radical SAM protein [Propionigenium maris]GLI54534.1 radical SAM protein [Propionigenium maris DSM 9537]